MKLKTNNYCIFSPDRKYRYVLWRVWDTEKPYCMFIGLNPSTADEIVNDNTVTRCINYSRDWGYGSLCMTNLFAWRETKAELMKKQLEPIGLENNEHLLELSKNAGIVIAAWGNHGEHLNRGNEIKKLIPNLYCLKISKNGNPYHPLYLKSDLKPIKYE